MSENHLVLVVEDNDFVRMQIVNYLTSAHYSVLEAAEGEAAMDQIGANDNIDLAIVDVRMEPVGGFEFVKAIRGLNIKTPVILVTGDETPDLLERANMWGISAVLKKPVQKDRLLKVVERTIAASKKLL